MEYEMSLAEQLVQLEQLRDRGSLNEAEFAQAKARLLQAPPAPVSKLSALNGLRRSTTDRWVGGVCGGLAEFTGVDAWLWRLAFTLMLLLGGTGLFFYIVLWVLVPLGPDARF
jgi:phage shock protein C